MEDPLVSTSHFYVCDADAMVNGEIRQVALPGAGLVAVYRVADAFYATDDTCSHGQALLSEGEVDEDCVVECPWHGGTFDVRTGQALSFPCVLPIKAYPVAVENNKVYLDLGAGTINP